MADTDLLRSIERQPPQTLLAIGDTAEHLLEPFLASHADLSVTAVEPGTAARELAAYGVHDIAVVSGLDSLSHIEAGILLGQLRDLYARRVLVLLNEGAGEWRHRDMIGHGFTRFGHAPGNASLALYEYDIAHYKTTPDWLNDRYWANPRLYDKYRW